MPLLLKAPESGAGWGVLDMFPYALLTFVCHGTLEFIALLDGFVTDWVGLGMWVEAGACNSSIRR